MKIAERLAELKANEEEEFLVNIKDDFFDGVVWEGSVDSSCIIGQMEIDEEEEIETRLDGEKPWHFLCLHTKNVLGHLEDMFKGMQFENLTNLQKENEKLKEENTKLRSKLLDYMTQEMEKTLEEIEDYEEEFKDTVQRYYDARCSLLYKVEDWNYYLNNGEKYPYIEPIC